MPDIFDELETDAPAARSRDIFDDLAPEQADSTTLPQLAYPDIKLDIPTQTLPAPGPEDNGNFFSNPLRVAGAELAKSGDLTVQGLALQPVLARSNAENKAADTQRELADFDAQWSGKPDPMGDLARNRNRLVSRAAIADAEAKRFAEMVPNTDEITQNADFYRLTAESRDEQYGVNPALKDSVVSKVAGGLAKGSGMAAEGMIPAVGLPLVVGQSTLEAGAAARNQAAAAGKTYAEQDEAADKAQAFALLSTAAFMGQANLVQSTITKVMGANASPAATFIAQLAGGSLGNEATARLSAAAHAAEEAEPGKRLEAAKAALTSMDAGQIAQSIGFGALGAAHAAGAASRVRAEEATPIRAEAPEPAAERPAAEPIADPVAVEAAGAPRTAEALRTELQVRENATAEPARDVFDEVATPEAIREEPARTEQLPITPREETPEIHLPEIELLEALAPPKQGIDENVNLDKTAVSEPTLLSSTSDEAGKGTIPSAERTSAGIRAVHRTNADFSYFDDAYISTKPHRNYYGVGHYFSFPGENLGFEGRPMDVYGSRLLNVDLDIKNPFIFDRRRLSPQEKYEYLEKLRSLGSEELSAIIDEGATIDADVVRRIGQKKWVELLKANGYDGIIVKADKSHEIVAFNGTQVKILSKEGGDTLASKTPPTEENRLLSEIRAAAEKAPSEADLDAKGQRPTTVEFQRPGGGKAVLQNTKEALSAYYDRLKPPRPDTHTAKIAEAVEAVKGNFAGVRIRVLRSESDLPADRRRGISSTDRHEGIVDPVRGDVFIFSDNILSPKRALEVIAHEVVGHYGVERIVRPSEWKGIADSIFKRQPEVLKAITRSYIPEARNADGTVDLGRLTAEDRSLVAREYIARLAEKPSIDPGLWQRIVAAVRAALRRQGIVKEWSEGDIQRLLKQSADSLRAPEGGRVVGEGGILSAVRDLGREVEEQSPYATRIEEAFRNAVPDGARQDAIRDYVEAVRAGGQPPELSASDKAIGDRFAAYFEAKGAFAERSGVQEAARAAYAARLTPDMALPDRLALYSAEVNKAVSEKASVGGAEPATEPAQPVDQQPPTGGGENDTPGVTSTKNAVMEEERAARGDEPIVAEARQSQPEAVARAQAEMQANPNRAAEAIERLRNSDVRTISVEDEAVLLVEKVNLMNKRNALEERAGNPDATPEEKALAKASFREVEKQMSALDEATFASGAIWGRLGAFRQRLLREDYSFEAVERRVRAEKGGALDIAEVQEIRKRTDDLQKDNAAFDARVEQLEAEHSRQEADAVVQAIASAAPKVSPAVLTLAERIVSRLETEADKARARIRARSGRFNASVDPVALYDIAVVGVAKLGRASLDFGRWSAEMVSDLGEEIRPFLNEAWVKTNELWLAEEARLTPVAGKRVRALRQQTADLAADRAGILDGIRAAASEGAVLGAGMDRYVKQLVKNVVDSGTRGLDNVTRTVREALDPIVPGITDRQVRDAFSDYGKATPAPTSPARVHLAQIRSEAQKVSALQDILEKQQAPRATGKKRVPQSDEARRLTQQINEAKRKYNIQPADPATALKSTLDARKTYYRNRLTDLRFEVAKRERVVREKSLSPTDAELDALKAEYAVVRGEHDAIFGTRELTDEQRLEAAMKIAVKNEQAAVVLLDNAKKGIFPGPLKPGVKPTAALESIRARTQAMRDEAAELRSVALGLAASKREAALTAQMEALNGKLMQGNIDAEVSGPRAEPSQRAEDLKAEMDSMRKLLQELRKPALSPEERALRAYKARLSREEADLLDRTARADAGDATAFERPKPKPLDISKDPQAVAAKARVEKAKEELTRKAHEYYLANRTKVRVAMDTVLEALSFARAVNLSTDLGFMGLQMGTSLITHPILVMKSLPAIVKAGWGATSFRNLTGDTAALEAVNAAIMLRPNAGLYEKMGIFIGDRTPTLSRMEDAFRSRWADYIPAVAHSARAMTAGLNVLRADLADSILNSYMKGITPDAKTLKLLGNDVNIWTGRGSLGRAEIMRGFLNHVFLAPGWVASRFQILYGQSIWSAVAAGDARAARIFAGEYVRLAAGTAALYGVANFLFGDKPEDDPRSSKFGLVKAGDRYYDFSAATLSPLIFLSRFISGQRLTNKGEVVDLRRDSSKKPKFGAKNTTDLAFKFLQGKSAPLPGLVLDLAAGEDIVGRPVNFATALLNRSLPLTPRQMLSIAQEEGQTDQKAAATLLQFMGINSRDDTFDIKKDMANDPTYQIAEKLGVDPRQRR